MAFSYTHRAFDQMGRGIVIGNFTATSVEAGTISTGFNKIRHADLFGNVDVSGIAYTASSGDVTIACKSGAAGTYFIYGE